MQKTDIFGERLPVLETDRLRLRHPEEGDLGDLFGIFGNAELMRYWSHVPWENDSDAVKYLKEINEGFDERTLFQWAITVQGEDRLIGTSSLFKWNETNRHIELGYILNKNFWGAGYAKEAVRKVLEFAFETLDVYRVEAEVDPRNLGSIRLLDKLGFSKEGLLPERWFLYDEWCDSALYGLLRQDFSFQE